jgi:predicted O-methyltransferase YrrM
LITVLAAAVPTVVFFDLRWLEIGLLIAIAIAVLLVLGKLEGIAREVSRPLEVPDSLKVANLPGEPLDMLRRDLQRDLSAMLALNRMLPAVGSIPAPGGWAATPETLLALVARILEMPGPALVVECGSGTSSVWIALALRRRGGGRLISLEHDPEYATLTETRIQQLGLADLVEVRRAPITRTVVNGAEYGWYAVESVRDIENISLLFVDGPPGSLGERARFPALSMLGTRVVDGGWIVLDDIDRADEQRIRDEWIESSLPNRTLVPRAQTDRAAIIEVQVVPGPDNHS